MDRSRTEEARVAAARAARSERARALYGTIPALVRQRAALEIAAWLMDEAVELRFRDPRLADWLRFVRPIHAREIATRVAAAALADNRTAVFDALMALDAADCERAGELYETGAEADWSPPEGWLAE